MFNLLLILVSLLVWNDVYAGTISRPEKSFGGTQFVNGAIPQDSDFNGDANTIYSAFNGNISNVNIAADAAIAPTKISPDGFTTNVRTIHTSPCTVLEESDQSADAKRWAVCVLSGVFTISTHSDAGATQNSWLTIARADGSFTLGGTSGTNTINGATTFNQNVTFAGATSLTPSGMIAAYFGTSAPSGWLLMDGGSYSCTGSSGVNANLCAVIVFQAGTLPAYKGSAGGTFTVDSSSNEIIKTAHGKSVGDRVHFSSTVTIPAPLNATVVYCIISTTTDRYKISTTCGGAEVDITNSGSGTHSYYYNFLTPNASTRQLIGTGGGYALGGTGGAATHTLTTGEMPAHTHTYTAPGGVSNNSAGGGQPIVASTSPGTASGSAGSGGAHNILDPYLVMTYIIKL